MTHIPPPPNDVSSNLNSKHAILQTKNVNGAIINFPSSSIPEYEEDTLNTNVNTFVKKKKKKKMFVPQKEIILSDEMYPFTNELTIPLTNVQLFEQALSMEDTNEVTLSGNVWRRGLNGKYMHMFEPCLIPFGLWDAGNLLSKHESRSKAPEVRPQEVRPQEVRSQEGKPHEEKVPDGRSLEGQVSNKFPEGKVQDGKFPGTMKENNELETMKTHTGMNAVSNDDYQFNMNDEYNSESSTEYKTRSKFDSKSDSQRDSLPDSIDGTTSIFKTAFRESMEDTTHGETISSLTPRNPEPRVEHLNSIAIAEPDMKSITSPSVIPNTLPSQDSSNDNLDDKFRKITTNFNSKDHLSKTRAQRESLDTIINNGIHVQSETISSEKLDLNLDSKSNFHCLTKIKTSSEEEIELHSEIREDYKEILEDTDTVDLTKSKYGGNRLFEQNHMEHPIHATDSSDLTHSTQVDRQMYSNYPTSSLHPKSSQLPSQSSLIEPVSDTKAPQNSSPKDREEVKFSFFDERFHLLWIDPHCKPISTSLTVSDIEEMNGELKKICANVINNSTPPPILSLNRLYQFSKDQLSVKTENYQIHSQCPIIYLLRDQNTEAPYFEGEYIPSLPLQIETTVEYAVVTCGGLHPISASHALQVNPSMKYSSRSLYIPKFSNDIIRVSFHPQSEITSSSPISKIFTPITYGAFEMSAHLPRISEDKSSTPLSFEDNSISNPNVVVVLMEGLSRAHFHRKMEQTVSFLQREIQISGYSVFEYFKFLATDFSTNSNLFTLFTGENSNRFCKDAESCISLDIDPSKLIWNQFKKAGYKTAFVQEYSPLQQQPVWLKNSQQWESYMSFPLHNVDTIFEISELLPKTMPSNNGDPRDTNILNEFSNQESKQDESATQEEKLQENSSREERQLNEDATHKQISVDSTKQSAYFAKLQDSYISFHDPHTKSFSQVFDYSQKFMDKYKYDSKFIVSRFLQAKDPSMEAISHMDQNLATYLREIIQSNSNSFILLISDQGPNRGQFVDNHPTGRLEQKLPLFIMITPSGVAHFQNLEENQQNIITMKDVYKTLQNILKRDSFKGSSEEDSISEPQSIFKEISNLRDCSTLEIMPSSCICNIKLNAVPLPRKNEKKI